MNSSPKVRRLLEAYPLKAFRRLSPKASNVKLVRQAVYQNVRRVGRAFGIRMAVVAMVSRRQMAQSALGSQPT